MKIARIDRHIARQLAESARTSKNESNWQKLVYSLYAGALEPLIENHSV
jgi:hypothetical protein